MPVLFIHTRYDTVCETYKNTKITSPMRSHCSDLTEGVLESGHFGSEEQPEATNDILTNWMRAKVVGKNARI